MPIEGSRIRVKDGAGFLGGYVAAQLEAACGAPHSTVGRARKQCGFEAAVLLAERLAEILNWYRTTLPSTV
jgi:hypothetical protein